MTHSVAHIILLVMASVSAFTLGWILRSWAGVTVRVRDPHGFVRLRRIKEIDLPVLNEGSDEVAVNDPPQSERDKWVEEKLSLLREKGQLIAQIHQLKQQVASYQRIS